MGFIEPITMTSAVPAVLPFAGGMVLWASIVGLLAVTTLGILFAGRSRRQAAQRSLRLVRAAEAA
jgi:hypothetical protein